MSDRAPIDIDVLFIGGGVAGLWALNRAVLAGYNAILIERGTLGGAQSVHSQGIIHSGTKYALKGAFTRGSKAIAAMPGRWGDCLEGRGELDLTSVRVLSDATYFWSKGTLRSRMTSFLASKVLREQVTELSPDKRPAPFSSPHYRGPLYRVNEPVLDVPAVIGALAGPVMGRVVQADGALASYVPTEDGSVHVTLAESGIELRTSRVVITAGEGFPPIAKKMPVALPTMQRRPLHMVAVKHRDGVPLFGHCIGTGTTPLVTITSHPTLDGRMVWYLGGQLAEAGISNEPAEQIAVAKRTLLEVLPGVTLLDPSWATLRIDRAEPAMPEIVRPDHAFAEARGPVIAAWPTKLALSPDLADRVLALLPPPRGNANDIEALSRAAKPAIGRPFWDAI